MPLDKSYEFDGGLKVLVDQASLLYLNEVRIDYVETMEGAGFKFDTRLVHQACWKHSSPSGSSCIGQLSPHRYNQLCGKVRQRQLGELEQ